LQTIRYKGGPAAHPSEEESHYESLLAERYDQLRIFEVPVESGSAHRAFRVLCTAIGEQTLSLHVGNNATTKNPVPRAEILRIPFACLHPVDAGFWVSLPAAPSDRLASIVYSSALSVTYPEHYYRDMRR
jgi:hypothetical protein